MAVVTMSELLEAGMHFGHQKRRWNPKMAPYVWGERHGVMLIDLHKTIEGIEVAYGFVRDLVARGGTILFVGTKKQAQAPIEVYARSCGMPYVNQRWLGGMLTNFQTIASRVRKLDEFEAMRESGELDAMLKKEALHRQREIDKLERYLGGVRNMHRLPDAVFIIDTKKEHLAVTEAKKLGLPIVAVVDTNCDPEEIDYVIPGNDDAIRAAELACRIIAEAVLEGRYISETVRRSMGAAPSGSNEAFGSSKDGLTSKTEGSGNLSATGVAL